MYRLVRFGRVGRPDAPLKEAIQSNSPLKFIARGDPLGDDDVRPFPIERNIEDLLFERGIDICLAIVRLWLNLFGPMFAGDIRRQRVNRIRGFRHWRRDLDEMYVK